MAAAVIAVMVTAVRLSDPFLSVTQPVHSEFLVVEGWIDSYIMNQVACRFKDGHYRKLFLVRGFETDDYKIERSRERLIRHGVEPDSIVIVVSPTVQKDRTYHQALAVRDWLTENGIALNSLDVVTVGPHARRSRLMFEKAFGKSVNVGIFALNDIGYDAQHWWRSSEGVREVLGEIIAYVYARFYFVWT